MQIEMIEKNSRVARDSKEDFSLTSLVVRGFIEFEFVMKKKKEKKTIDIAQTARDFKVSVAVVQPINCNKSLLAINSSRNPLAVKIVSVSDEYYYFFNNSAV